jgi:hypothetical protein
VRHFTHGDEHPVFWGYFSAYDWIAFNWLFGSTDELPFHYPQLCLDIKQWAIELGDPELPHQIMCEKCQQETFHAGFLGTISCGQRVEQDLGLLQIARVEAFGEPIIDRSEKVACLAWLTLIAPEPRHADHHSEFPGLCPTAACGTRRRKHWQPNVRS